ncbi:P-loop NTPase family protein [Lacrimispora algidixylanolytica]|uniref:Shikimate kinase n=1 Tax=Lacrimispora algidixylanolytica TaxID=94868 RepID=A0A419SY00_9FIRM|nr:AAA family ATPase [Lacrimispora algidixylanolytica]RKD30140.1 shikimate kinase [Lacrimispora algidixylanolytica]
MRYKVIHIYGASGSGTSTLGEEISKRYDYFHMDTDDYYWLPTDPRFSKKRSIEERLFLMKRDIKAHDAVVITGSLVDWGDELIPYFDLAIRVVTDQSVRLERIHMREKERFGPRIETGGDMFEQHVEFMNWAAKYDTGDVSMRSKANHDEWQKRLMCRQIEVDGGKPMEEIMKAIRAPTSTDKNTENSVIREEYFAK